MARVGKAAPGGSTRPTSLHQQTGAERQKGTGWAKRSVPTMLAAMKMVGTAQVRLCPPYEIFVLTCIADKSPPAHARAAAAAVTSIRRAA